MATGDEDMSHLVVDETSLGGGASAEQGQRALAHHLDRPASGQRSQGRRAGRECRPFGEIVEDVTRDVVLQDVSPLEGMQAMLKSRAIEQFHANDEELLVRHLHKVVRNYVDGESADRQGKRP